MYVEDDDGLVFSFKIFYDIGFMTRDCFNVFGKFINRMAGKLGVDMSSSEIDDIQLAVDGVVDRRNVQDFGQKINQK